MGNVIASYDMDALLAERQDLLDKLFAGTITKAEQARRAWISWQLDNLEEARWPLAKQGGEG